MSGEHSWHLWLGIIGILFVIIDIALLILFCLWWKSKKKEKLKTEENEILIKPHVRQPLKIPPVKKINFSPEPEFRIPDLSPAKNPSKGWDFDVDKYPKKFEKPNRENLPKICFELSYNFRTLEINVNLYCAKNLPYRSNEQVMISVLMTHSSIIYHTARLDGPHPIFNEDFQFPLESMQISSDPPIHVKFNVWSVDRYSKKHPFGFLEANIEEILTNQGLSPMKGKGQVWKTITRSDSLTDESLLGEVFVSLAYLQGAQRITLLLVKAKQLILRSTDKDVQASISLLFRDVVKKTLNSKFVPVSTDPEFHEQFVFDLSEFNDVSIDRASIEIQLTCRPSKLFVKPRVMGKVDIGKGSSKRQGREHWTMMLTSQESNLRWHSLAND